MAATQIVWPSQIEALRGRAGFGLERTFLTVPLEHALTRIMHMRGQA
jgi:hypothetical protein